MKFKQFTNDISQIFEDITMAPIYTVYAADKDGEIFEVTQVIVDDEQKRVYLIRDWREGKEPEWDKSIVDKVSQADAGMPVPDSTRDNDGDWGDDSSEAGNDTDDDGDWD